jgi:hypothetical protein
MSRISIESKTVNGRTAVSLEARILMYRLDGSQIQLYYSFYDTNDERLQEGNLSVTNPFSNGTKAALEAAVSAAAVIQMGGYDAGSGVLRANQLYSPTAVFDFSYSGVKNWTYVTVAIPSSEYDLIKANVLAAVGATEQTGTFRITPDGNQRVTPTGDYRII